MQNSWLHLVLLALGLSNQIVYTGVHNPDTLSPMAHIGIRDLRSALSTFIKRAHAGERIVITVDGNPIAQLSGLGADQTGATMADLVARGAVLPPRRRGDWVPGEPMVLYSGARIDRALSQVRL
jgi:prevent-host-death family protein